jgi:hypothetical protein
VFVLLWGMVIPSGNTVYSVFVPKKGGLMPPRWLYYEIVKERRSIITIKPDFRAAFGCISIKDDRDWSGKQQTALSAGCTTHPTHSQ